MGSALTPSTVAKVDGEAPRFFSLSQRIGRLRYLVYTLAGVIGCALLLVLVYFLAMLLPPSMAKLVSNITFILVKGLLIPMMVLVFTMRRFRDFNLSGWWALTVLIPLAGLVFLFIPGSKGENRFGPQPAPNHAGLHFLAIALPIALLSVYYTQYRDKDRVDPRQQFRVPAQSAPSGQGLREY